MEWRVAVDRLAETRVGDVALPRFTMEWEAELDSPLGALGMGSAFDPAVANFGRMAPVGLWLETVQHKTYLRVDEEGTEAAAVTGGLMLESGPASFWVDRPLAFTISDRETGTILFLGTVTNPLG